MTRKVKNLARFGLRGSLIRLNEITDAHGKRYAVVWGKDRTQVSFPGTMKGKREAQSFIEGIQQGATEPITEEKRVVTTRALWDAFKLAKWPHLRGTTKTKYEQYWNYWAEWFKWETPADAMTPMSPYQYRDELERLELATSTIQKAFTLVRTVYTFGAQTELITKNRWQGFKLQIAKDKRTKQRAEYRQEEFLKIWKQFDPANGSQWRGHVAIGLLGIYGMRQSATLQLKDADFDEIKGTVTYRAETDKQGEEHVLPLLPKTRELLAISRAWRERLGYTGPYILPPGSSLSTTPHYTIQALHRSLEHAERTAKIPKIKWRAGHGFRRGLVGDLLEAGNDMDLALKAIGDRDINMAKHYAVKRNDRIDRALSARVASFTEVATEVQPSPKTPTKGSRKLFREPDVTHSLTTTSSE